MNPMTDDNKAAAQVILAKLLEIYDAVSYTHLTLPTILLV